MGVNLHLYTSRNDVVTADELRGQLHTEGWDVRFVLDQARPALELAPEGPLTCLLNIIGWPASTDAGRHAAEAIDRRDLGALQRLYEEGVVGSCGLSVIHPFCFEEEFEDEGEDELEDEDDEPMEEWVLDAMRRARTRYGLRVVNLASNQSYRFLNIVWRVLGQLRGGLLVDPQMGTFLRAETS